MSEPFLGQISIASFNFAPKGWALCNGQILAIAQNQALFALLGTTFGGNGQNTFGLPDLRGRAPMFWGGTSNVSIGQQSGTENHTLSVNEMPSHSHGTDAVGATLPCSTGPGTSNTPTGRYPAVTSRPLYADAENGSLGAAGGATGSSQHHTNMQPFLTVNFIIALQGIFPSRN